MPQDALRILILEDVPMDAELVEYELERARIPFASRRVDSREDFCKGAGEFPPRSDPLRLHPSPLRRHDRTLPGQGAGAEHPLSHRHRLGERGDGRRMHEGRGHRLPAQEQSGPDRSGHRGRAGAGARPRRKDPGGIGPGGQRAAIPLAGSELIRSGDGPRPRWHHHLRQRLGRAHRRVFARRPRRHQSAGVPRPQPRRAGAGTPPHQRQVQRGRPHRVQPPAAGRLGGLARGGGQQSPHRRHDPGHRAQRPGRERAQAGRPGAARE